ncbi:MAG TPA: serine hydrolase domain-containing protein [Terrimicrobiaceae bacterium]|nr:serine hydrolase domain-containing protein [Terrimicrobiaceae bacterium]
MGGFRAAVPKILSGALAELDCRGILCAVNCAGSISTYSAGIFSADSHAQPFPIYSITKTFTAVAVLLLEESQGPFLDRAAAELIPDTPVPPVVTVRQLLNHTGGLSDYFASSAYREDVRADPSNPWTFDRLLRVGLAGTPLFPPGEGWAYSNPGYMLLNLLIERLSGVPFQDFVARAILQPLALGETRAFLTPDSGGVFLAAEEPSPGGDYLRRYAPGWIGPGCLISTVSDLVRFFDGLFAGKLVGPEALAEMTAAVPVPVPPRDGIEASMGLGLMHGRHDPLGEGYGHGGGGPGYTTYAVCYPGRAGNLSVSLVVNRSLPATPFAIAERIVSAVRQSLP